MQREAYFSAAVLFAIAGFLSGCSVPTGGSGSSPSGSSPATATAGQEVRDGKFAFTVSGADAPQRQSIGDQTPQGEFIVVHLSVKNIGNEAQTFFASNQKLIDANRKQYSDDMNAELALPGNNQALDTTVNPGLSIGAAVVFDVPVGTVPAALEVHDSAFSAGAKVALPQPSAGPSSQTSGPVGLPHPSF